MQSAPISKQTKSYTKVNLIIDEIRYLCHRITDVVFRTTWNELKYRFVPQHRHHILNLLKSGNHYSHGWYDTDTRMLHACFLLLVEFVEKEEAFKRVDWECDEKSEQIGQEIKDLYDWWKIRRSVAREQLMLDWSNCKDETRFLPVDGGGFRIDIPESHRLLNERENQLDEDDQHNLERLIKIRSWLWT